MKKLIVLIAGLMFWALPHAYASVSNMTAQLGVYNSTDKQYGLEVDNSNNFIFAPSGASIKYPSSVQTTNFTLTAANSGQIIVFTGTSNYTRFTLPTATVGMDIDIVSGVAKYMTITPASTDTIVLTATLPQGANISNSGSAAVGDEMELFCAAANTWYVRNQKGTWAQQG